MIRNLILGGPGAGKTERLADILEKELSDGILPERVAFVSFTKAAVNEAAERMTRKFHLDKRQTIYFKTLHSLCYWQLGLRRNQVMDNRRLKEFGREIGVRLTGMWGDEAPVIEGDRMVFLQSLAMATERSLMTVWEEYGGVDWTGLEWFARSLRQYKDSKGLVDFSDMLSLYTTEGNQVDVDVVFIDEAQDLTSLQWKVVEKAFQGAKRFYIAGDDDQAIYEWAGADIKRFRKLMVDKIEVLPKSHRLPADIFKLAQDIALKIEDRYEKAWGPASHQGSISWVGEIGHLDFSEGTWLLLARNTYLLENFITECRHQGVPYETRAGRSIDLTDIQVIEDHERIRKGERLPVDREEVVKEMIGDGDKSLIWHEAFSNMSLEKRAYYVAIRRRGEKMKTAPRIKIDTIHGVKGREADNVAIILDMAKRSHDEFEKNPDSERRVLYVGLTRARQNLYLVMPQTALSFEI